MSKSFFQLEKDLYICFAYIPPENSSYYKARNVNTLEMIEEDIVSYSRGGSLCVIGDLNARTNSSVDFIENDSEIGIEQESMYVVDDIKVKRHSCDKIPVCSRGKQLLDLCKSARLRILNGRCLGDSQGCFTSYQHNGCSVVDYCMVDEDSLENFPYF